MRMRTGLALLILGLSSAGAETTPAVRVTRDSYEAGGRRIKVDHFEPSGAVAKGTAIVLYGAGGIILDGPRVRLMARTLAEDGYDVSLIHYFDRTGTLFGRDQNMQQNFEVWLDTVRKGIAHARSQAPPGRLVYVYGYSLGAFLAVASVSDDGRVAAVAEHAGGIWNNRKERLGRMPPVLLIHGQIDQRVPFDQYARPLLDELRRKGGDVATHFYADEGHNFTAPALVQVRQEVARFFDAHPRAR